MVDLVRKNWHQIESEQRRLVARSFSEVPWKDLLYAEYNRRVVIYPKGDALAFDEWL